MPRKLLWSCVREELQHEMLGFATMRYSEIRQEFSLTQEVLSFARELFQALQEGVVKTLCVCIWIIYYTMHLTICIYKRRIPLVSLHHLKADEVLLNYFILVLNIHL